MEGEYLNKGQNERRASSFVTRLLSGIVLVVATIGLVDWGGLPLFLATLLISMVALFEIYRVCGIERSFIGVIGYLTALSYYLLLWYDQKSYLTLMIIASLMLLLSFYVLTYPKYQIHTVALAFMAVVYVAVMLSYLYETRAMVDGRYLVCLIYLASWGSDTCAYCTGMLFGKHKMTPLLSPKKTVEGAVGGILGASLLGALWGAALSSRLAELGSPVLVCALACGAASLISMLGDLSASAIKRDYAIKDYGHCIPGHGGVMDRFDSVIFTAPAIYFLLTFLKYI